MRKNLPKFQTPFPLVVYPFLKTGQFEYKTCFMIKTESLKENYQAEKKHHQLIWICIAISILILLNPVLYCFKTIEIYFTFSIISYLLKYFKLPLMVKIRLNF